MNSDRSLLHFAGAALLVGSAALLGTLGCQSEHTEPEAGSVGTSRAALATQKVYVGVRAQGEHTCGILADGSMNCFGKSDSGAGQTLFGQFDDVSLGDKANCAIRSSDKTVVCWGNTLQMGSEPPGKFRKVSAQGAYACGILDADGSATCWGYDGGAATNESVLTVQAGNYTEIATGYNHVCALTTTGTINCWGSSFASQLSPPVLAAGEKYTRVVSGYGYSCALTGGNMRCWGDYANISSTDGADDYVDIAANSDSVCVLDTKGKSFCWGLVGFGTSTTGLKDIAVGQGYVCAVTATGGIECWGNSDHYSTEVSGQVLQVADSPSNTCVLRADKTLQCFGEPSYGVNMPPPMLFKAVAVGDNFACGIDDANGKVHCWGDNLAGQDIVPTTGGFTKISAEGTGVCALNADTTISCWGALGDISSPPGKDFVDVETGYRHACALDTSKAVTCFGQNFWGELSTAPHVGEYISVAIGKDTGCAVRTNKSLLCWGSAYGEKPGPYTSVSISGSEFCAIRENGKLDCWSNGEAIQEFSVPSETFKNTNGRCGVRTDDEMACFGELARNVSTMRVQISPQPSFELNRYSSVNTQFAVTGGTAPYTFKTSLGMPPGLMVTSSGLLKGSPSSNGQYGPALTITDAKGLSQDVSLYFLVMEAVVGLEYVSGDKQSAYVGDVFAQPLVVSPAGEGISFNGLPISFAGPNLTFDPPTVTVDSSGKASVKVTATGSAGPRKVWATVGGVATPVVFELTAKAYPSLVNIQTDASDVRQGERVTVSATVDSDGKATGKTYFYMDDELYCIKELASQAASCKLLMSADGEHQLSVKYLGDGRNSAAVSEMLIVNVAHDPNYVPPSSEGGAGGVGGENGSGGSSSSGGKSHSGGTSNEAGATSEDVDNGKDNSDDSGCSYSATSTASSQAWAMLLGGVAMAGAVRRRRVRAA